MDIYIFFLLSIFLLLVISQVKFNTSLNLVNHGELNKFGDIKISKRAFYYYLTVLIAVFFSAIRYGVGWDYWAYYHTIIYDVSSNIMSRGETFTILLIELARLLQFPQIYFIINSILSIFVIAYICKKYSIDYWFSFIFFVTFPLFYLNSLSVVRNFTAIALTFFALKYLVNKKFIKYLIVIIIASLFHKSALFALVFYFTRNINLNLHKIFILILSIPLINKLFSIIIINFFPTYSVYLNETTIQEGTKAIFVFLIIGVTGIILQKKLLKNDLTRIYFNNFFIGLIIYMTFFNYGTMGHRLSLYGTIYSILLLPELLQLFRKEDRIILKSIVYVFCIIMFLYTLNVGSETYIPYRIFINK